MIKTLFLLVCAVISSHAILITTGYSANELADYLVGSNVTIISSAHMQSTLKSTGKYENAFVESGTESLLFNGVVLSSGNTIYLNSNYNSAKDKTLQLGLGPDSDLQSLLPIDPYVQTYDACYIEFDFVPEITGTLKFNYMFGSEEYFYDKDPMYERYTDVMGIFIDGENIALLPGTNTPIGVKTVNEWYNSQYFNDNNFDHPMYATELDGFTDPLTAQYEVIAGQTYHFKTGVTDANDLWGDSYVLAGRHTLRVESQSVPEPSTIIMIIIGLLVFGIMAISFNSKKIEEKEDEIRYW